MGIRNVVIDGSNFCFRASVVSDLTNKKGEPIYVPYIALKMLRKLIYDHKPDQIVFTWDGGRSAHRVKLLPDYKYRGGASNLQKAHREEIMDQIHRFRQGLLTLFPVYQFYVEGFEADDLIRAVVTHTYENGGRSLIVSSDHDFYQLLDRADVLSPAKEQVFTQKDFEQQFGFLPENNWLAYRCMVGDASDNIPGVERVGDKTAKKIILEYGDLNTWIREKINDPEKKQRMLEIYDRNLKLISLDRAPEAGLLFELFQKEIADFVPVFDKKAIKDYMVRNFFQSILSEWNRWIKPFGSLLQ